MKTKCELELELSALRQSLADIIKDSKFTMDLLYEMEDKEKSLIEQIKKLNDNGK